MDSRAILGPADAGQGDVSPALLAALSLDNDGAAGSSSVATAAGSSMGTARPTAADDSGASTSADEMTCSICLQHTELEEIASISPGCGHSYCVKCILRWAAHRDRSTCPQCKSPFDYLLTYYRLDGTLNDFPCEESVTLLKRARFFTDHMQVVEQGRWKLSADDGSSEWRDYEPYFQEYDEDEAVEDYYFSAAAGRARIVLGNRRFGENGYVSSGRAYARPAPNPNVQRKKKGGVGAAAPAKPATPASGSGGRRRRNRGGAPAAATAVADSSGAGPSRAANSPSFGGAEVAAAGTVARAEPEQPASSTAAAPAAIKPSLAPAAARRASASQPIPVRAGTGGFGRAASASPYSEDSDGPVVGASPSGRSPPLGSSPGSGTPGTGRRARRNSRRAFEDSMAAGQA